MKTLREFFLQLKDYLDFPIFRLGDIELTLWAFLYMVILFLLLLYVTNILRRWIVERLLAKSKADLGMRQAAASITRYIVIVIGFLIIIQTAGIDLTTLNVIAGAVGLGVGFGLQNIANNFISGLIILFERPIKIGDRIDVGDVEGDVVRIGGRGTTVLTNDNIAIIIPNSKFISENVINWSYNDEKVRFKIPVSVAYGSDVRLVEKALLEVARENPDVLDNPAPSIRFMEFGDSGLLFELRAWTMTLTHRKGILISALNFAIYDKFKQYNIEIPFPQRDVHIRSGGVDLRSPD